MEKVAPLQETVGTSADRTRSSMREARTCETRMSKTVEEDLLLLSLVRTRLPLEELVCS